MKKDSMPMFECIRERDMDLLLMEEWCVNSAFAEFFLKTILPDVDEFTKRTALHSLTDDAYGESDIVLAFRCNGRDIAVLVEDKIDAIPQPEQAKRYQLRAKKMLDSARYDEVHICIVAPQHYLDNDTEQYPNRLSYESIADFLSDGTERGEYKAMVVRLAISQERRHPLPVKNEAVTDFWQNYYEALRSAIPEAEMPRPKNVPINSDWPVIRLPGLTGRMHIVHKMAQGNLDLETGLPESDLQKILLRWNVERMMIAQTGKSFVLRIPVPALDRRESFSPQEPKVNEAFAGIRIFQDCLAKYGLDG